MTALKSNSNTVWFNFQTYIYIYIYIYIQTETGHGMFIFFNKKNLKIPKELQILLNKMNVYFLLVSDSMSINAKFPVMLIG